MKYILLAGTLMLTASCANTNKDRNVTGDEDTMVLQQKDNLSDSKIDRTNWNDVDFTSPIVSYEEVKDPDIVVRAKDTEKDDRARSGYTIYEFDQDILFDLDKSDLNSSGKDKLQKIATSIKQRYPYGRILLYGFTDSIYTRAYNKELSRERAATVKDYLSSQGIDGDRIEIFAEGQTDPVATNATARGRQKNRRVEIVVRQ